MVIKLSELTMTSYSGQISEFFRADIREKLKDLKDGAVTLEIEYLPLSVERHHRRVGEALREIRSVLLDLGLEEVTINIEFEE